VCAVNVDDSAAPACLAAGNFFIALSPVQCASGAFCVVSSPRQSTVAHPSPTTVPCNPRFPCMTASTSTLPTSPPLAWHSWMQSRRMHWSKACRQVVCMNGLHEV